MNRIKINGFVFIVRVTPNQKLVEAQIINQEALPVKLCYAKAICRKPDHFEPRIGIKIACHRILANLKSFLIHEIRKLEKTTRNNIDAALSRVRIGPNEIKTEN